MIAIKTPRLVLRKFLEKDVPGLLEYFRNPRVACFLDEKVENPDKMLEEIRRRNESPEGTELAVCIRESDNVIGNVFSRKEMEDTYSVGWNLNKNYEGKGYAAEAAKVYLDFLFTKKNVRSEGESMPMLQITTHVPKNFVNVLACVKKDVF